MFVVQQVPDSNLVLVVTQADCDCSRQYGPIPLQPKEIKYILNSQRPLLDNLSEAAADGETAVTASCFISTFFNRTARFVIGFRDFFCFFSPAFLALLR